MRAFDWHKMKCDEAQSICELKLVLALQSCHHRLDEVFLVFNAGDYDTGDVKYDETQCQVDKNVVSSLYPTDTPEHIGCHQMTGNANYRDA